MLESFESLIKCSFRIFVNFDFIWQCISSPVRLVGAEGRSRQTEDDEREVEAGQRETWEGEGRIQIFGKAFKSSC